MEGLDPHLCADVPTLQPPDVAGVLAGQEGADDELARPNQGALPWLLHREDLEAMGLRQLQSHLDLLRHGEGRPPRGMEAHQMPAIHGQPDRAWQGSLGRASWQADVRSGRLDQLQRRCLLPGVHGHAQRDTVPLLARAQGERGAFRGEGEQVLVSQPQVADCCGEGGPKEGASSPVCCCWGCYPEGQVAVWAPLGV